MHEFHISATGGHSRYYRTYRRLDANLYLPGMIGCINIFVCACDVCQRCKASSLAPGGLMQPLEIPAIISEDISMDFTLSKYGHFDIFYFHLTILNL